MSSVSASLGEIPEKSVAETSGGREVFGEEGRTMLGTSLDQGEEVGAFVSRSVRMSRMMMSGTSSEWGKEVGAATFEFAGMSRIGSDSGLSCICNPTDIKWFDNDHAKGLLTLECPRYPNLVPLRSSGVPSASVIPCS